MDAGEDQEAGLDAAEDAPEEAATICTGVCGDPGCGACPTMPMISAQLPNGKGYLIDSLETTVGEYQVFLDANVPVEQDEACEQNDTYEPWAIVYDYPEPDMPIHAIDWCNARAYCAWAGKRLCKAKLNNASDPTGSEWMNACTLGGTQKYPYGDTYDSTRCPGGDTPHAPGSVPTCEGAYPGLFDMVGNTSTWLDACTTATCSLGGIFFSSNSPAMGCVALSLDRMGASSAAGIRCCKDYQRKGR